MKLENENFLLYKDWLNLSRKLLWCHNNPVREGCRTREKLEFTEYTNNGAWLVREGWAEVEYDGQLTRAEPGQWLIIKPGQRIQRFSPDARLLSVAFEATWPDGTRWLEEGLSVVFESEVYPELEECSLRILNNLKKVSEGDWDVRQHRISYQDFFQLDALLSKWLFILIDILDNFNIEPSRINAIDERVMQIVRIIQNMQLGDVLDLDQLASQVHLSPVHLTRLFRQFLNTTPKAYFDNLRFEHACDCFKTPDTRIAEVSADLGFKYLSHFSRWFSHHMGMSPRAYIKKCKTQ